MIICFPGRVGILLLLSLNLSAQQEPTIERCRQKYPDDYGIVLKENTSLNISLNREGLNISENYHKETFYYSEPKGGISDETVYSSSFSSISDMEAWFFEPADGKYHKTQVRNITEKDDYSDNIFYDDSKKLEIVYPKVKPGSKTSLQYTRELKDAHFLGRHFFNTYFPTRSNELRVSYPGGVELGYSIFNDPEGKIKIEEKRKGKKNLLVCSVSEMEAFDYRENDFSVAHFEPHIALYIKNYTINGKKVNVLSSLDDLYDWYYSLVKDVPGMYDPLLKTFSDSLTKGLESDMEKTRAIYYWVQDNIKYVAFEDGYGGFVPRPPAKVLARRYGDCKDMAMLCNVLLGHAGINAHLSWVGTRDIPYTYEQLHTPAVDNHMIVSADIEGKQYFLDPTDSFLSIGLPSSFIQGKQALVSRSSETYDIFEVPVPRPEDNLYTDTTFLTIDGDKLKGRSRLHFSGYFKNSMAPRLKHKKTEKLKEFGNSAFRRGNNKFAVEDISFSGEDKREGDLLIDYTFNIPGYSRRIADNIYINLNLNRLFNEDRIDLKRKSTDKRFGYKYIRTHRLFLEIPETYSLLSLPPESSYSCEDFSYSASYTLSGEMLMLETVFKINTIRLGVEGFSHWNEMVDLLKDSYKQSLVLKKIK